MAELCQIQQIVVLAERRPDEGVRLDPERILALYADLGEASAEAEICATMEEMAVRLAEMQRLHATGKRASLARSAAHLARSAASIGMTTLGRVAGHVGASAEAGDAAAQASTMARLVRIGGRSLTAVWDMRDMRG